MCGVLLKDWFEKKRKKKIQTHMEPQNSKQNSLPHKENLAVNICIYVPPPPPFSMAPATTTSLKSPFDRRRSKDPARELFDETDVPVLEEFTLEQFDMLEALLLVPL